MTRERPRRDRSDERLQFLSPEQYRAKYGREPVAPEAVTTPWPDAEGWHGWTKPWPPPTVVVVMAEWTDAFLWNRSPDRAGFSDDYVLDPEVLGVSPRLTERLRAWNDRYHLDAAKGSWVEEGWALAHDLQREFDSRGLEVEVRYHDRDGEERPVGVHPRRRTRR